VSIPVDPGAGGQRVWQATIGEAARRTGIGRGIDGLAVNGIAKGKALQCGQDRQNRFSIFF